MNKFTIIVFFAICVISLSCESANRKTNDNDTLIIKKDIYIGYLDFKLIGNLTRINKIDMEPEHQRKHFLECNKWFFDEESAHNLLSSMKEVDGTYAYHICQYFPCWYVGKVSNDTIVYEITIYAHSAITLSNKNETLFFIMEEESELFIAPCYPYED